MRLFFYGTMRDPDVRRLVLGDRAAALSPRRALLQGFQPSCARDGDYPVLVRRAAARAQGELVEGLHYADLLRLFHFEGPGYHPSRQLVIESHGRRLDAWVLLPDGRRLASAKQWRLRQWQLYRKPRILPRLRIWMQEYDRLEGNSVDITWPVRRQLRAWRQSGELLD